MYMEGKTKTNWAFKRNSGNFGSGIDVTGRHNPTILSLPSCVVLYPPEVKFHAFRWLKRGEEKSISKKILVFLIRSCRFNQANNKKSVMYTLRRIL